MLRKQENITRDKMTKKLFIDVGVGKPNSEAWGREKEFIVIGLEPGTERYNKCKDVYPGKLLNVVAIDKDGEIKCWESPECDVRLFLRESENEADFKKVKKKTIKLDSLDWRDFDEIHIWADIEGAELLMLKGATEMLSSGKVKWLNLEVRRNIDSDGWCTANQVYRFLDAYGFRPTVPFARLRKAGHQDVIFTPQRGFDA